MRAVIAQKTTKCHHCKEDILPGQERLEDMTRMGRSTNGQDTKAIQMIRRHFHFDSPSQFESERSCYDLYAIGVFEKLPHEIRTNHPQGRPRLDLTSAQTIERNKILKYIGNQVSYYLPKINLTQSVLLLNVAKADVRRAENFRKNLTTAVTRLQQLGGVPEKYKGLLPAQSSTNGGELQTNQDSVINTDHM